MAATRATMLACKVSQGMVSTERGVAVDLPDGRTVSVFVDARNVVVQREPSPGAEVPGQVKVSVVELRKDSAVIDLPEGGIAEGPQLRVPRTLLEM